MKTLLRFAVSLLALGLIADSASLAATTWTPGKNYFLVDLPRPPAIPGKVEVTEVFSYGCPACNAFLPTMRRLKQSLSANAVITYLPASFNPSEDWPMFQVAFFTAQTLGVAEKTHEAMFDAVWNTGELAIIDPATQHIKSPLPTIADAAAFYKRQAGIPVETFLSAAKSFGVDNKVRGAEASIVAYQVDRTPTIIVNGKYRLHTESAGGEEQLIELVDWLVAKDSK